MYSCQKFLVWKWRSSKLKCNAKLVTEVTLGSATDHIHHIFKHIRVAKFFTFTLGHSPITLSQNDQNMNCKYVIIIAFMIIECTLPSNIGNCLFKCKLLYEITTAVRCYENNLYYSSVCFRWLEILSSRTSRKICIDKSHAK